MVEEKEYEYCLENNNKERILKPITPVDIVKIFSNKQYRCNEFSDNILLMKLKQIERIIIKNYSDYKLDLEKLTFIGKKTKSYDSDFYSWC